MRTYTIAFTKEAIKDFRKLSPKLQKKCGEILDNVIRTEPRSGKHLVGELKGLYSLRLTHQDRIVYEIDDAKRQIMIYRVRTHYGD